MPKLHITAQPLQFRNVLLTLGILLVIAPATSPAQSQTDPARSTEPVQTEQHWLRVSAQRVNLRSRADLNSRIVGRVNRDDLLDCRGVQPGWRKIVPPRGVYSLVSAQYVERVGTDRGIIKVDNTLRIRVGSDVQPRDPMLSEVQTRLKRDDEVKILGLYEGGWLKIVPPEGVYVYIAADYVERVTPEVAQNLRQARTETAAPTGESTEAATTPTDSPDLSGPWGQRMTYLLDAIQEEQQKPDMDQDWDPLLTLLKPISEQREEPRVALLAEEWTQKINQRTARHTAAKKATELAEQAEQRKTDHAREVEQIREKQQTRKARPRFDAQGVLRPSFALPTGPYGLRYKIQDPFTDKVAAYIEIPTELGIDIKATAGKYVGVRGKLHKPEGIKVSILRVTELTILDPDARAKQPTREKP